METFGDMIQFKRKKGVEVWTFGYDPYSQRCNLHRVESHKDPNVVSYSFMKDIFDRLAALKDSEAVVFGDIGIKLTEYDHVFEEVLNFFDQLKKGGLVTYRALLDYSLSCQNHLENQAIGFPDSFGSSIIGYTPFSRKALEDYLLTRPDTSSVYIDHGIEATLMNGLFIKDSMSTHEMDSLLLCDENPHIPHGYILVGMSGCGKSTLIRHLLGYVKNVEQATKYTTREVRSSSEPGVRILSEADFDRLLRQKEFAASYEANGRRYGYMKSEIESSLRRNVDIIFDTTSTEFASAMKEAYPDYARIVLVQSEKEFAMGSLVRRYEEIPENLIGVYDARMDRLSRDRERYKMFGERADFVLRRTHFALMQQELRNYILGERFGEPFKPERREGVCLF